MKKTSKQSISLIQRKIWVHCRRIIRRRYGNSCYTCPASNLLGSNWQTGHLFPKASLGAYLKYDLRVLRPQCFKCNIHYGGMGATFIEKMRMIEGDKYVNQIIKDKQVSLKAFDHYQKILLEYEQIKK